MKPIDTCWLSCAALALTLPIEVMAQASSARQAPAPFAQQSAQAGFDKPVSNARLSGHRGGTEVVHNDLQLSGTTAGNTAVNVATGTNAISAGAFANMSGLPVVIQNSGANVLIQNAVILNLQMN